MSECEQVGQYECAREDCWRNICHNCAVMDRSVPGFLVCPPEPRHPQPGTKEREGDCG